MHKQLKRSILFIFTSASTIILSFSVLAASPSIALKRLSPNAIFARQVGEDIIKVNEWLVIAADWKKDRLQIKGIMNGVEQVTVIHKVELDPSRIKANKFQVSYVGFYNTNSTGIVDGYCLLAPVGRELNPEIDLISNLPQKNELVSLIDLKGRPIQVKYYESQQGSFVEAYLLVEMFDTKIVMMDNFMPANTYNQLKPKIAEALTELIDFNYNLLAIKNM